ncbi:MAG: S-layer homology domain-containing protein [Clostridiales bacterium]|nr:MAG: S-layer homology domain-containing protein [Clostridiales bacterium]
MLGRSYTVSEDFEKNLASAITTVTDSNTSNNTPKRSGSGGGGGGGLKVSTPIVPDTDDTTSDTEADNGIFADIKTSHWAYQSVLSLVNKNIISRDTNFRPNDYITREEFAKIISVVFEPIADKYPNFDDVDASSWYAPYINSVYSADLVKGISENKFGVGLNITREDMAVIIFRALKAEDKEYDVNFADKDEVSDYALNAVGYLNANGLFKRR